MRGILFDKDGTLIDFSRVWEPTIRPVILKTIDDCGLEPEPSLIIKLEKGIGVNEGKIDPEGSFAWKPFDLIADDMYEVICSELKIKNFKIPDADWFREKTVDYFLEEAMKTEEYPGFTDLPKLFKGLKDEGIKIGIATTDSTDSVMRTVEKLGIKDFIGFYGTADNGMPVKPDPRLIFVAADIWKCKPEDIMVVGDTPNDMRFAKAGHALALGVLSGTADEESLRKYTETIIPSIDNLMEFLNKEKLI